MHQLKRRTLTVLVCTALLAISACQKKNDGTVIKIGHVAPISGSTAHLGKDNENGAKLAKGITIDGKKVSFELVAEDDAADPKQGTSVAQKLVDAHVNAVVGHLNSGTTIPASKIYNDAGIPQITPSATNPKYTQQGFKGAFRVVANDQQLGGTLGRFAVDTFSAKSIAVIDDRTTYGQGVADEFIKGAESKGAKIVAREYTTDKATDFNAILTKIKATNPEVIFFGGMDAVGGPMLRQIKALGINVKFMGGDGICSAKLSELAGDAIGEGTVVCAEAGGVIPSQQAASDAFKERFTKRFQAEPQLYSPYVYDAVMTFANAMQQANSADPAKYLTLLAKIKHEGVTGTIEFDAKGDMKEGTLTLHTYKAGKKEVLQVVKQ
jgi:branched-chain amino acid transport system substrate-binding protein